MTFDIRPHLGPPTKEGKYDCPACGGHNLSVNKKNAAYTCFDGCSSAAIRNAIAPLEKRDYRSSPRKPKKLNHSQIQQNAMEVEVEVDQLVIQVKEGIATAAEAGLTLDEWCKGRGHNAFHAAQLLKERLSIIEAPKSGGMTLEDTLQRLQDYRECEEPAQKWQLMQDLSRDSGKTKRDLLELERNTRLRQKDVEVFTASEFGALNLGAQEYLFEGLIPSNRVAILAAEAKTGKSLLTYDWAYHAAMGQSWQGFHCPQPRRVLIVQTDESPLDCQERFRARGLDALGDRVRLIFKFTPAMMPWLKRKCREWCIDLVIFDSLTSIQREAGFGPKDPEYGNWLYDLKDFCADCRITAIVTHHTNKSAVEAGLGKMAGSYAVPAAASENLMLVRPKDPSNDLERVLLRVGSRSAGGDAWHLSLSLEDFSWAYNFPCNWDGSPLDGDFTPDDQATLRENVRAFLIHHRGQFLTVEEIENVIGGKRRSIGRVCRELMSAGIVTRKPSGIGKAWAYAINLPDMPPETVIHLPATDTLSPKEFSLKNQSNGSLSPETQSRQGKKVDHLKDPSVIHGSFQKPSKDPDSSDTSELPPLEPLSDRELTELLEGGEQS